MWLIAIAAVLVAVVVAGRKGSPAPSDQRPPGGQDNPNSETSPAAEAPKEGDTDGDIAKIFAAAAAGATVGGLLVDALGGTDEAQVAGAIGGAGVGVTAVTAGVAVAAPVAAFVAPAVAVVNTISDNFAAEAARKAYEQSRRDSANRLEWDHENVRRWCKWMDPATGRGLFLSNRSHSSWGLNHGEFLEWGALPINKELAARDIPVDENMKVALLKAGYDWEKELGEARVAAFYFDDGTIRYYHQDGTLIKQFKLYQYFADLFPTSVNFYQGVYLYELKIAPNGSLTDVEYANAIGMDVSFILAQLQKVADAMGMDVDPNTGNLVPKQTAPASL